MSEPMFVITEEELRGMEICQQRICHTIRSRPLSKALEESYKNGFNDGQAEGMPRDR